jgi:hypothetical protein
MMLGFAIAKISSFYFAAASCSHKFFFFPDWWEYLSPAPTPPDCSLNFTFPGDIWLVGLAVLDILIRLAGFLAVISIIIAGAQLLLSEGSPEKATSARNRLLNSLIGLAIAAGAVALVTFLGNQIGGASGTKIPHAAANQTTINNLLDIAFVALGALAFLVMVLAGFRVVMSRGDTSKIAEARRQMLYGALGLLVIGSAAAIVNFVVGKL